MPSAGKQTGPLVVILGPTAVGKTSLSLAMAQQLNGEIVSADSRLVYRGMDIGVAKPSPQEQALVKHHLLDIVAPDEHLSLAVFQRLAYQTIDQILAQGRLPLLVGGTGQYISAVIDGWGIPEVPPDYQLREELAQIARQEGNTFLHNKLQQVDEAAASAIHPNNVRRVIRALEVYEATGQPISELQRKSPPPYHILQIGLQRSRAELYARIDQRIDQMLADGLLEEVQQLLAAGYERGLPAMSGLGYAQLCAYLAGETSQEEAIAAIRRETRAFARRQDTWYRKYNQAARWFEMTETTTQTIIDYVQNWLESKLHAAI